MATAKQNPVSVRLNPGIKNTANLYAYVVDQNGQITEATPFKGADAALKSASSITQGQSRVYIGQAIPKELGQKANERMLIKAGAYQVQKGASASLLDVSHLPAAVFKPWNPGTCLIQGNITNTVTIDGKQVTTPLCHARVHIIEVETELVFPPLPLPYHIPDWVLKEIQNILTKPPIPDPIGPVAGPHVLPTLAKNAVVHLPSAMLATSSIAARAASLAPVSALAAATLPQASAHALAAGSLPPLPAYVLSGIASTSLDTVRKTLADNIALVHPYLCLWPNLWPWIYKWDEDHTVFTDNTGHFQFLDALFDEDGPLNIYIWVEAQINGQWVTVYQPPLPCNTHWNYQCNTPINIGLHDGRIPPCISTPLPGEIVWVKRIGDGTSIRNIALHPTHPSKPSLFTDARGLAPFPLLDGSTKFVSPFSQSFPIYVQFGEAFSQPNPSATHFRWKYRRIADADLNPLSESFTYQQGSLGKYYTYEGTDSYGQPVWYTGVFPLDSTIPSGKIYKIPNVSASVDTGIASATWNQDTVTIVVDALSLQNGLYEYVLELCDGAGNLKALGSAGFQVDSLLPAPNPSSVPASNLDTQDAAYAEHYIVWNQPHTKEEGFRFLMRIDNDHSTCVIYDAVVLNHDKSTATTDTQCGFAQYQKPKTDDDRLLLRFYARQPHRFAEYSFQVVRGNGNATPASMNSVQVPEPHISVPTNGGPLDCQVNAGLASMLGTCDQAAFAEHLYLWAYHTNGSRRVWEYDSSALAAIAVEPKP